MDWTFSSRRYLSALAFLLALAAAAGSLGAQVRPTPAQAQAALQARPELVEQLKQRIGSSGLSPEQVRARLRAEGYPENLLDGYLNGLGSKADLKAPTSETVRAIRALGLVDDEDAASLLTQAGVTGPAREREMPKEPADSGREIFGLSLFRQPSSQFRPNLDGPVDRSYRIGPGDQLVLILTGDVEEAYTLDVTREGFMVVPQVGQLPVSNLSLEQLEDMLYSRLKRVYSGIGRGSDATTRFSVSVAKLRSIQVFVTGDVSSPGAYRMSSASTTLTALYAAGGPTGTGSLRAIEVRRGGARVATLDVYDYLLRGDASNDAPLRQGDIIFVPTHGPRVRVVGEVLRPATYELRAGESLRDVLLASGGLKPTAGSSRVLIERILSPAERAPGGRDRSVVDVALGAGGEAPRFGLVGDDVVRVPGVSDRVRNRIAVRGHVTSAGLQGFSAGLTLTQALQRAGGVKSDAYLGRVLVSRLRSDSTREQLHAMLRDSTGQTFEPFELAEDDEITVFSRTDFRPYRSVAIGGAVRRGGQFSYREGMTLRDLVLLAGGLLEGTYLKEVEIARLPAVRNESTTATSIRVPIDSSYTLEGATADRLTRDFPLLPYDNVLVLKDPTWQQPRSVQLTGEVRFPGRYTLRNREERLSDVLARAGGLTAQADGDAAYFTRFSSATSFLGTRKKMPVFDSGKVVDSAAVKLRGNDPLAPGDTARLEDGGQRIRVGLDLRSVLKRRGRNDDLALEDGDSLNIPSRRQTVEVRGEVNAPTAFVVKAGSPLGDYINSAGGPTSRANASHAYVIQPNGTIESRHRILFVFRRDPTPRAGATVVVPSKEDPVPGQGLLASLAVVTQLIASLAAIVALSR